MKVSERALREIYLPAFEKVVVLYKDRLLRFGFELIEYIASLYNCEIEIIDNTENPNSRNLLKIKKLEKQKRRLQRSISRSYEKNKKGESYCKTNNVIKKEKLLLKRNHRLTNIRKNYLNQTISEIVNRKPRFICIEDLNVSGMMKNRHLSKAVQAQGFFGLENSLNIGAAIKGSSLLWLIGFIHHQSFAAVVETSKKI